MIFVKIISYYCYRFHLGVLSLCLLSCIFWALGRKLYKNVLLFSTADFDSISIITTSTTTDTTTTTTKTTAVIKICDFPLFL